MAQERLYCPHCGQAMRARRGGGFLPPIKTVLFDTIKARGGYGASTNELVAQLAETLRHRVKPVTVRVHIGQLNLILTATRWRIASIDRRYVLVQVPEEDNDDAGRRQKRPGVSGVLRSDGAKTPRADERRADGGHDLNGHVR